MGGRPQISDAWVKVSKALLQSALHCCKKVTLDIDATEIVAYKAEAQWTYNKNKGFIPMAGHITETGQIVAVDFRQGNSPPAQDNLAFIKQCQQSLPEGCTLNALRIDAAGDQIKIIQHCDEEGIEYAMAVKVVKMGRQVFVKLKEKHRTLLEQVLIALKEFEPLPV